MRWSDEHYVKLYTRDTPTWKAMCWQAKALWPLLMRKIDKAGLLECGELGRSAVPLMVDLPDDVALAGLKDLERLGVVVWHGTTLEAPKFEEAQEARKSDALRKRDERKSAKDKAKADGLLQPPVKTQDVSHGVQNRPKVSQPVTLQPSPTPSPAQPDPSPTPPPAADEKPSAVVVVEDDSPSGFWNWAQRNRREVLADAVPEEKPVALEEWAEAALAEAGPRGLSTAYLRFLADPHWQEQGCPFAMFARPKVWRSRTGDPPAVRDSLTGVRRSA